MNERIKSMVAAYGDSDLQWNDTEVEKFAELIVRQCGYYADVFDAMECPVDTDPTETKPSDYIKREMGITE